MSAPIVPMMEVEKAAIQAFFQRAAEMNLPVRIAFERADTGKVVYVDCEIRECK